MNISDVGALLTYIALGDSRTVTKETAAFWYEALRSDISFDEARSAVSSHFANSTDYLAPAHINAIVTEQRRVRTREVPPVIPPRELADEPAREIEWRRTWEDAVIAGHTEDRAREIANQRFDITEDEPLAIGSAEVEQKLEEFRGAFLKPKPLPSRMPQEIRRLPARWAADRGLQVLDPDGWREAGIDFRAPCTEAVYDDLIRTCTVGPFVRDDEIKPMQPEIAAHKGEDAEVGA